MDVNKILNEYKKSKELSFYEKFCNLSYSIFKISLSKEERENYERLNKFCKLRIPPASNISAALVFFVFSLFLLFVFSLFFSFSVVFFFFILFSFIAFLIYYYPFMYAKVIRSAASSEMMHAIIYMTISLKQVPNLEKAISFAASNLEGEVGKDFKEAIAKILFGEKNAKEALLDIIERWYGEAREFCEAVKMLITYSENPYEEKLLNEAIRLLEDENFARLEKYTRELKLPSSIILGLGIILPLLTLTILPLFSIFFPGILSFNSLIIIYNVILPIILFIVIISITTSRPLTSSYLEIENPLVINFKNHKINLLHVSIMIAIFLFVFPFLEFFNGIKNYELCAIWFNSKFDIIRKPQTLQLEEEECRNLLSNSSTLINLAILSLSFLIFPLSIIYIFLRKFLILKEKTEKLEQEFPSIIYQIGYSLKIGKPLEIAILEGIKKFEKFEIKKLFENILSNLRIAGNLKDALFNALKEYPSSLLKSSFEVILDSYKRGYIFVSEAMITISSYLNRLFKLQNKIEETISDTVSSLKFIAVYLTPIIVGTGISLAIVLLSLLNTIAVKLSQMHVEQNASLPTIGLPFISFSSISSLASGSLVFAMGIYVLEIVSISSFFIVSLEKGFEKYYFLSALSKNLFISLLLYFSTLGLMQIFLEPLISSILQIS